MVDSSLKLLFKPSMFNYFYENEDGKLVIYNSYLGLQNWILHNVTNKNCPQYNC